MINDLQMGQLEYKINYYDQSTYQSFASGVQWTDEAGIKNIDDVHAALGED